MSYSSQQRWAYRRQIASTAVTGYLMGQFIGTTAYVLQMRQVNRQALSSGVFLGVVFSIGSIVRLF